MRGFSMKQLFLAYIILISGNAYSQTVSEEEINKAILANSTKTQESLKRLDILNNEIAKIQEQVSLAQEQDKLAREELAKKPNPKIGMTKEIVINETNWGKPQYINRTTTRYGIDEQFVYSDYRYLYFKNGKLTTIQD